MSELVIPESWATCSISQAAKYLGRGKSPKYSPKETGYYSVNQRCIYWEQVKVENGKHVLADWFKRQNQEVVVKPGDILLNSTGTGTLGRANIWSRDCENYIADSHVCLIRCKQQISPKYFLYLIRSRIGQEIIESATTGSTNQIELSKTKLGIGELPLPPLGEQRRIVAKIESTFKSIEAIEKAVESAESLLTKYRESLLNKAFRGELVPQDPRDEPASKLLERIRDERVKQQDGKKKKKDELPPITEDEIPFEIPKSWEWVRIPEVGSLARGKSKHRPRNDKKLFGGKYPFIQTGDVAQANGYIVEYSQTYSDFGLSQSRLFPPGTLCITIAANIADTAILTFPACFPDSVVGYSSNGRTLSAEFLKFFIELMKVSINKAAHGAAQKNINLEVLGELPVPLPPFAEQVRIVETLKNQEAAIGKIIGSIEALSLAARKQRGSILGSAFSGHLVPQVQSEGTGHQLLEQILAAKSDSDDAKANAKEAAAKAKPRKIKT